MTYILKNDIFKKFTFPQKTNFYRSFNFKNKDFYFPKVTDIADKWVFLQRFCRFLNITQKFNNDFIFENIINFQEFKKNKNVSSYEKGPHFKIGLLGLF